MTSHSYADMRGERNEYWGRHPTRILMTRCMDGRLNVPEITGTPLGLIEEMCAFGGRFRTSWTGFMDEITDWIRRTNCAGFPNLFLMTGHFDGRDNKSLGCRGFNHSYSETRNHMLDTVGRIQRAWQSQLCAIAAMIDTNNDEITLCGAPDADHTVTGSECIGLDKEEIRGRIQRRFPHMRREIVADLAKIMQNNAVRVDQFLENPRSVPFDLDHQERVIWIGGMSGWIPRNLALAIHPSDTNIGGTIRDMARIIQSNIRGAGPDEQILVVTCHTFDDATEERGRAEEETFAKLEHADNVLKEFDALYCSGKLHFMAVTQRRDDLSINPQYRYYPHTQYRIDHSGQRIPLRTDENHRMVPCES